jgi:hypothetical protein
MSFPTVVMNGHDRTRPGETPELEYNRYRENAGCKRFAAEGQAHTVRGFVSILGSKGGETVEASKNSAGERAYKITK